MRSTFAGLNTMVRGLYANQTSLDTVSHNVANSNTDGYSRQKVNLATTNSQTMYGANGAFQIGTGVSILSVTRSRDVFVDRQMWKEASTLGYGEMQHDILSKVEAVFREPTDTGVQTVLNKFWTSLQNLSTDASNESVRTAVRQRGVELVDAIKHSDQQLKDMVRDVNSVLDIKIGQVNQITMEIASLNRQIVALETGKTDHANDLRDRRDLLTDELSGLLKISITEDKNGNYNISSGNLALVAGTDHVKLETVADPNSPMTVKYGIEMKKIVNSLTGDQVDIIGGAIGGLLEARDSNEFGIKAYLDKVDTISRFLLQDFNEVHRAGYGLQDSFTGINFFGDQSINYSDPAYQPQNYSGSWTAQLQVNKELFDPAVGLQKIAAKTMPGTLAITKSNATAGELTVDGNYNGPGGQTFTVRIESVSADGRALTVKYTTGDPNDGTTAWLDATPDNTTNPTAFTLSNGVIIRIGVNINNTAADTYSFAPTQGNANGDNAILLGHRLKLDKRTLLGNASLDTYYNSLTGGLGVQVQNAKRLSDNQRALVDQISVWRESTSGINLDEEMSDMIRFQKGYSAAARMVTAVDEMLDKLINGTGVTGR